MSVEQHGSEEPFLRFYRWSMLVLLVLVILVGATLVASAIWPDSATAHWLGRAPWYILLPPLIVGGQQLWLRRHRLTRTGPEAKVVMDDEWRRTSVARATRSALVVVLVLQFPLGFLLRNLPTLRAVMAMASLTVTLGVATQVALSLLFDRE